MDSMNQVSTASTEVNARNDPFPTAFWARFRTIKLSGSETLLFIVVFIGVVWVQQPTRFSFFGDSWDVLYLYLVDLRTILQPHNEHFIPIFKAFYFLEYKIFGAHHLGYMLVLYFLHSLNAVLVYQIGERIHLSYWSRVVAALLFGFTSVTWEVTGWSFEQVFVLGTFFWLAGMKIFLIDGDLDKKALTRIAILSLLGYWTGGPIVLSLPVTLTAYWMFRRHRAGATRTASDAKVLLALWGPVVVYYASVRLAMLYTSKLAVHPIVYPRIHLHLRDLPAMIDFSLFGAIWGLVLPTLTFLHFQALLSITAILILLSIVAIFSYNGFTAGQRIHFWLLAFAFLAAYFVISLGRIGFGIQTAASSRYQYLPMVPFALLCVLCWDGIRRQFPECAPSWWQGVSILVLGYLLLFHGKTTRVENPAAERGEAVQKFLQAANKATFPAKIPNGIAVLGANFQVPTSLIFPRRPLWMIQQVLQLSTTTVVPVEQHLADERSLQPFNFIRNSGFEEATVNDDWQRFAGAEFSQTEMSAHSGRYGVDIMLPHPGSAFAHDVIRSCTSTLSGKIFTFAVWARTQIPNALVARVVFKAVDGSIIGIYSSSPHEGGGMWRQLVTGGLSPQGTCTIGVDVANDGSTPLSGSVDDVVLVLHPGILQPNGAVAFESPAQVLSKGR